MALIENRVDSGMIECLSDDDLHRLNEILPWKCFTVDSCGRRYGNPARVGNFVRVGKRDTPQRIPDLRIAEMDRLFNLSEQSVLEVGCFEGIHTIGLAQFSKEIYAIDSRIENVVKTIVRTHMFGFTPTVFVCDVERDDDVDRLPTVDFAHHVGVLYHLKDPVTHLFNLTAFVRNGILLDTHYATPQMVSSVYALNGKEYHYYKYREKGRADIFSGMNDHSKWLLLDDIRDILVQTGYSDIRSFKDSVQRNGPRVTLFAARPSVMRVAKE